MSGSIINLGNNRYRLRYMYKGKHYNKNVKLEKGQKIDKLLNEFIYEIEHNINQENSSMFFNDFCDMWYEKYVEKNLSDKTQLFYKNLLIRIKDYFISFKLNEIKRIHIIDFLDTLTKNYVKSTIDKYRKCLMTIFNFAIKCELVEINPVNLVKSPNGKEQIKEENFYNLEQIKKLLELLENNNKILIVELALFCGLRRQEILALNKSDIDFEEGTININKAIVFDFLKGSKEGDTKNLTSTRIVYAPKELLDKLNKLPDGKLFNYTLDYITRWFGEFIKENNLPHLTFHGLRHTNATLLIANGIDYKTVSEMLGHSKTSTTMNIYVHKDNRNIKNASNVLSSLFKK